MKTFEELGVSNEILRAITEMGFVSPMPVQEEVIPYLTQNGGDIVALAQTGTGKTAAYGIPLLMNIDVEDRTTQAVILSPTRELCLQIADDLKDFSKYMEGVHVLPVYGGTSIETQIKALSRGVQIIVATPGRLIDLTKRGKADLSKATKIVLDEADRMLDMGFQEDIDAIFEQLPEQHETLLFSATMSREVERVAKNYLKDHKEIVVGSRNEGAENVNHVYYMVSAKDKYLALKRIVDYYPRIFAIIFCRTKIETQEIADKLIRDGYNAESLHGDLSQQQRDLTMAKFRQHTVQLLVATDVAARGLDVEDLTHVINFGLPDDIESYTHRSGRTGRAGKKGTSISIVHSREKGKIRAIEKQIQKAFEAGKMPTAEEICKKQLYKVMDQIVKTDVDEEQIAPFLNDMSRFFEYVDKEDLIKKIVSLEFGKFLAYYANAPELETVSANGERKEGRRGKEKGEGRRKGNASAPERGYKRLFINLGKKDGFFPGDLMQLLNRTIGGRQLVGHIDLQNTISYFEVPERDANHVARALTGAYFKDREVRCNDADQGAPKGGARRGERKSDRKPKRDAFHDNPVNQRPQRSQRKRQDEVEVERPSMKKDDWRQFFQQPQPSKKVKLKGEEPDFSEEGWAVRKPRKK